MTLFDEAKKVLVGGVNSPVRAFKAVGGDPIFFKKGQGPYLYAENDKQYIDYVLSWGPHLLGHAHPAITEAIKKAADNSTSFGAPSVSETKLATKLCEYYPFADKVRLVNSGTEATMSAIRLARGATKRPLLVKFNGCYHGHSDSLLIAAGSGALTYGEPNSAGVLKDTAKNTLVLDYNDTQAVDTVFKEKGHQIAGVIVEPVCGNMGVVLPEDAFIRSLRKNCDHYQSILIFDEVMAGFRSQKGATSDWIGVTPDIVTLGKVIGGGLPCGAYLGKNNLMSQLAPEGPVYQAGTLSGNPLVMAAGLEMLHIIQTTDAFEQAQQHTTWLVTQIKKRIKQKKLPIQVHHKGTMFSIFFTQNSIKNLKDVNTCNVEAFTRFYHVLLKEGVYFPPSQYEACFMSSAHKQSDLEKTLSVIQQAFDIIF